MTKRRRILNEIGECYIAFSKIQSAQEKVGELLNDSCYQLDTMKRIEMQNAIRNLKSQITAFEERHGALYETAVEEEIPNNFIDLGGSNDD